MDNGPIATGASPGKLRQLNGNGQLFVGKIFGADFALSENVKDKSSGLYPVCCLDHHVTLTHSLLLTSTFFW